MCGSDSEETLKPENRKIQCVEISKFLNHPDCHSKQKNENRTSVKLLLDVSPE